MQSQELHIYVYIFGDAGLQLGNNFMLFVWHSHVRILRKDISSGSATLVEMKFNVAVSRSGGRQEKHIEACSSRRW